MEEALIKRVMPHSIEAEQSVVGAMLMDKDAITTAGEIISGDDFYQASYGVIFDSMIELFNEGKPVDLITLQERLKEKDVPAEIASLEFVRDLVTAVPTSANVKYYAQIVADKSLMRKMIKLNESIENMCYAGKEPVESIMEQTEKSMFQLLQRRTTGDYVPIKQVVLNALDKIEKASKSKGTVTGIPTGFIDLDYKLSGFQPSDFILIAARPSMGKTAFVLNIAQYMAFKKNKAVAIFSLEMSKEQLVNRLFSLESQVDAQSLRTGNMKDSDWEKLIEGAGIIGQSKLIIDDTPETITVSCFDPIRREVARLALEHLIKDGRIQPGRIEEVVHKIKKEMDTNIMKTGEDTVFKLGIGRIDREIIRLIGRLKYRFSYGQNALQHSMEVAHLTGMMAAELGLNQQLAKRAGLLHDIGKALDFEVEGSHIELGYKFCKKHGEREVVLNAIQSHHGEVEPQFLISNLVIAADTISAARPGARYEALQNYINRLEELEKITKSFDGVDSAYAIQAGREVRVMAVPEKMDDLGCHKLARDIKDKIEAELTYPGQIKVTVIRETRACELAK